MKEKLRKIIQEGFDRGIFTVADLSFKLSLSDLFHMSFSKGFVMEEYGRRIFDIASVTKMILTLLIYRLLTLEKNSEFSIDAPISRFIDISGPYTNELTVYDLMTYHAEFNRFITPIEMLTEIMKRRNNPRLPLKHINPLKVFPEMIKQIKCVGLKGPSGLSFRYANVHSILLGFVLEGAFGKGLEELMKEYLLIPLGLADTTTDPMGKLHRCVQSHYKVQLGRPSDSVAHLALRIHGLLLGSAGLFSTTKDLLCFLDMVLLGDQHQACHIRDTFADNLHRPVTDAKNFGQGFGLWSKFLENLEEFHPNPPDDLIFRSGSSGVLCACSKRENTSIAFATNFKHKRRTQQKLRDDSRVLHEIYARIANCVFSG